MAAEIRHIGIMWLCGLDPDAVKVQRPSTDRDDLPYSQYKGYEKAAPFRDEEPYRYCKRCLAVIKAREKRF